ncbi:MAG: efflux RND transporter periplasmic adaptor subunit, partial [Burkholderiaceae bacterium]
MDYFRQNKKVVIGSVLLISLIIYIFLFRENSLESSWKTEISFLGSIDQGVAATGTINPKNTVEVGTQISGIIEGVFVDYNDTVQVGTLLAIVDSSIIDANIEQLEANLSAAEAVFKASESKYAREKRLHEQNFISISTLENTEKLFLESKSRLALAQAELKREKRNKTFTNITSPISGVVMEKKIDVGQTVAARFQTPTLFKIAADLNSMQIEALVSEADIGQVKRGQRVKFFVDAFFEELFEGTVELIRLEPKVEQGVVNYIV